MNNLFANVAYDPSIWFAIPVGFEPGGWGSRDAWASEIARYLWKGHKPKRGELETTEAQLLKFAEIYGVRDPEGPEIIGYIRWPHPRALPLLLKVWIDDAEGMTLADAAMSDDPSAVEPPVVEDFSTVHLGMGCRALRYLEDDITRDGSGRRDLYAVLHYAFIIPEENALVVAKTVEPDIALLMHAMDDIDAFVREIRWAYEPQDLVSGQSG